MNELTTVEANELETLESTIAAGLETFMEVGGALSRIREAKLYRAQFGTFEDYCQERWGMTRQSANRMIAAAKTVGNLEPIGSILPATESQARPLTRLEPEQQAAVWQTVVETAPNGKVTAAHVESVVSQVQTGRPHVSNNSGNNEWYTPPEYIEAARAVMGEIDTDPASSDIANETVGARLYFTENDNGLAQEWRGRVWMNPPYAQPDIGDFCNKLAYELGAGRVYEAITLTNNATETAWFRTLSSRCAAICFPAGRIKFLDDAGNASGAPLQGQAVMYFGERVDEFVSEFSSFGQVFYAR